MSFPLVDIIVKKARSLSLNDDHGDEYGISDQFFLDAINLGNDEINKYLVKAMNDPFGAYKDIPLVADQDYVALPSDIFAPNLVYGVQYREAIGVGTWRDMDKCYARGDGTQGVPCEWFQDGDQIYFDYTPAAAGAEIRVHYEKGCDSLDFRRGQITSAATTGTTELTVTTITLDEDDYLDAEALGDIVEYVCVNDRDGNVLMRNIPIASYDASSRVLTCDTFTGQDGETIPSGAFITIGADTTTHVKLGKVAISFYVEFARMYALEGESSEDLMTTNPRLINCLETIAEVYGLETSKSKINQTRGEY